MSGSAAGNGVAVDDGDKQSRPVKEGSEPISSVVASREQNEDFAAALSWRVGVASRLGVGLGHGLRRRRRNGR